MRIAAILGGLLAVCAGPASAQLTVTDWAAKTGPLHPHSAIVEGASEIGLVDVQQTASETHRLVADVLERGKPVRWIYVTHPHLDHFAGADIVRAAFPGARLYGPSAGMDAEVARQVATRRLPLGEGAPGGAGNLPTVAPRGFERAPDDGLRLDGERVEILRGTGDHPDSSVVWVPSARTVIAGDVIFHRTHAFHGDHDDLAGWIALVERVQALKPATVVAGHSATPDPDGAIVDAQLAWLRDLQAAMQAQPRWQDVREAMMRKYPGYANDFIFEFSHGVREARRAGTR